MEKCFDYTGMRILLTEDNNLFAEMIAEILTLCHASVQRAVCGEEAVELLGCEKEPFDAVLMDVHMPGMGGFEAARAIRALAGREKLPVFAMTAGGDAERANAMAAGMNGFLPKPFEIEAFDRAMMLAHA